MEAVLFDLDGTLLDTSEGVIESFFYVTKELGYQDISMQEVKKEIGSPVQNWFMKFYNISFKSAQEATDLFRNYYLQHAITKAKVYPGVFELLDALSERGIKIAVATYKREDCALAMLDYFGISKYCLSIHGADNFNKLKKADIVELCLTELNVDRQKVVLVGDTSHDSLGAHNAGINFIGVSYGLGFKPHQKGNVSSGLGIVDKITDVINLI